MIVDVVINVRYDKTTPVGPGKSITTTETVEIRDSIEESAVETYISNMTPVVSPA